MDSNNKNNFDTSHKNEYDRKNGKSQILLQLLLFTLLSARFMTLWGCLERSASDFADMLHQLHHGVASRWSL